MAKASKQFNVRLVLTNPLILCAVGFGSGLLPRAPGTWGTVVALFVYLLFSFNQLSFVSYLTLLLLTFLFGVWCCSVASRAVAVHDHPSIVCDEFVGYWLTMLCAPSQWWWACIGFVLFRVFDIVKPFPIGTLDRHCQGGLGIMLDDVLAGLYAFAILQLIVWVLPHGWLLS